MPSNNVSKESSINHESISSAVSTDISKPSSTILKNRKNLLLKLKFYRDECKRFSSSRVHAIENIIENEQQICNLTDYMIGTLQCKIIFESFEKQPISRLTCISLQNNHLSHHCCGAIASFIHSCSTLCDLDLAGCKIGDEGIKLLVHDLALSPSITKLNLSNNNISDRVGELLGEAFFSNGVCEVVNLSCNVLGRLSMRAWSKVLLHNQSLKALDLHRNRIGKDSEQLLSELQKNEHLKFLDVSWNGLGGDKFIGGIAAAIKSSKLKVLRIENNSLKSAEVQKMALGLKQSETIREVFVGGNALMVEDELSLVGVFTSNSPLELLSFGCDYHLSHKAHELFIEAKILKPQIRAIYQNVLHPNPPREVSMLDICADRAKLLAMTPKLRRLQRDMGVFMRKLRDHPNGFVLKAEFLAMLKEFNPQLDNDLIESYIGASVVQFEGKKRLDIHLMASHYLNRHPQ